MAKAQILLIDDEVNLSKMIKLNLERTEKYEVITAASGEEGVRIVAARAPDLVITDFNMPGMNGQETADAIKQIKPDLPVILMTVYHDDTGTVTASTTRKVDALISKPVDHQELYRVITEMLLRKQKAARKQILVIDDEVDFARLLKLNLEKTGEYEVVLAHNGQDGLKRIRERKPDVVLLDVMMPVMDGMQTLKEIKRIDPQLPVAMVTACWNAEEAKRIMEAGAYEYITKPVDFNYLNNALLIKLFA